MGCQVWRGLQGLGKCWALGVAAGIRSDRVRISHRNRLHEPDHRMRPIRSGNHRARGNRDWTNRLRSIRSEFFGDHCRVAGLLVSLCLFLSPFIYPCLWVSIAGFLVSPCLPCLPSYVTVRCRVPGILVYLYRTYKYIHICIYIYTHVYVYIYMYSVS